MRKLSLTQLFPLFLMIAACSQPIKEIKNPQKGKLLNRISCVLKGEKQFLLDSMFCTKTFIYANNSKSRS